MKIACAQFVPAYRDTATNLEQIRKFVHGAEADLIVLPELALTGYFFQTKDEIAPLAETLDGALATSLSHIAEAEQKAVITGFLERDGDRFYNSALAFDAHGKLAGKYRKLHLFYYETQIFERGNIGFPVFSLSTTSGVAKVGMLICYDWRYPEAARVLALQGAELIAMPSNIVTTTGMLLTTLQTRAFENKVALAFADRIGSESLASESLASESLNFRGSSAIVDMNGRILAQASEDKEEIIVAEIDLSKTRNKRINPFNDIFSDRPSTGYGL